MTEAGRIHGHPAYPQGAGANWLFVVQESLTLAIEWWPIDRVRPYEGNPRLIPKSAVAKVAASIKAYGWRQPIVVDSDGVVIAGHTRLKAAQHLGAERVPVHAAAGLTPAQARAYRLADNRVAEETAWDVAGLRLELAALDHADRVTLGFEDDELDKLLAGAAEGIEEPPAPTYSEQYGVIVICGSAAEQKTVYEELAGTGRSCRVVTT